jgi:capsular polysaccharide transport system ATP-binding protein
MITLTDVHKRYRTSHGPHWVLRGITLSFPAASHVAVLGPNGAGKTTLLRLIGGIDSPDRGRIERHCRVSWPLGLSGGLQEALSGHQNARFICRIHGREADMAERLAFVRGFSELGTAFDEPVRTYSSGMRARLAFALSLAFDFDTYLVDEVMAVGDAAFKAKSRKAFEDLAGRTGLILVSHDEKTVKSFCKAGVVLREGQARWFDSVDEAFKDYKEGLHS